MRSSFFQDEFSLPRSRADVFAFFAEAQNLEAITPPWLRFEVLTPGPIRMGLGTLIDYRLRLHGFPFRWRTEITAWDPPFRFVDEQRRGPYRRWIHEHRFTAIDGGTLCQDRVEYQVTGGRWIERLFVRRDIERIFAFRRAALATCLSRPSAALPRPDPTFAR